MYIRMATFISCFLLTASSDQNVPPKPNKKEEGEKLGKLRQSIDLFKTEFSKLEDKFSNHLVEDLSKMDSQIVVIIFKEFMDAYRLIKNQKEEINVSSNIFWLTFS